jgi:hypothetical protein
MQSFEAMAKGADRPQTTTPITTTISRQRFIATECNTATEASIPDW